MNYERLSEPLAPTRKFVMRLAANLVLALVMIGASLVVGMWGYHNFEGMGWIDAFANAAMILSGMGPLAALHTDQGKLFAGAPPFPFHAQVREATAPIFYKILLGEVGPNEGLDQMAAAAEAELKNLGYRK